MSNLPEKKPIGAAYIMAKLRPYRLYPGVGVGEALASSAKFIEDSLRSTRCDNDGVACCVRCNSLFLARSMLELLAAVEEATP